MLTNSVKYITLQVVDDLAEEHNKSEREDSKIHALQPQGYQANEKSKCKGGEPSDNNNNKEGQFFLQESHSIYADSEKCCRR